MPSTGDILNLRAVAAFASLRVDAGRNNDIARAMSSKSKAIAGATLTREWTLPAAVTLGSNVRARGILLELRARLSGALKKSLDIKGATLVLSMLETDGELFGLTETFVSSALDGIESLPVIPREIEDILAISTTERHRWLKDGRLPSAGTRTVKLHGRASKITFHVFDPRRVEEILDEDKVTTWRENDVIAAAENRRRAAWKAKLTRSTKSAEKATAASDGEVDQSPRPKLAGWEDFERDGPLR